uniref:50S ribosome-binding GTPase, putative n=1 Tax=Theileria annulata TaxID=5874 RepID=A0A3B0MM86_THEAN
MKILLINYLSFITVISRITIAYNCKIIDGVCNLRRTLINLKRSENKTLMPYRKYNLSFIGLNNNFLNNVLVKKYICDGLFSLEQAQEPSQIGSTSEISKEEYDIFPDITPIENGGETLVFSDFSDLYKDLTIPVKSDQSPDKPETTSEGFDKFTDDELDREFILEESVYSLSKRLFVKKLFKKLPQIVDTKPFLVRSKAYVKGKVGSKCDLSMFDSNKVKTAEIKEKPFEDIKSILPGVFTGLHTLKHTKKRIIRELKVKLDLYVKAITSQLKNITNFYGQLLKYIHPFQYTMLKTCLHELYSTGKSKISFDKLMGELELAKKQIIFRGNDINKQIGNIKKCRHAFNFVKENIFELDLLYSSFQNLYDHYKQYSTVLTGLPLVDIEKPIISIIGHVNVGKTTLFNKLSLGLIFTDLKDHVEIISDSLGLRWSNLKNNFKKLNKEGKVADYKFTTRGINLSILTYKVNNFIYEGQVIDTPGLLWRQGHTNYNPYEKLTVSSYLNYYFLVFCLERFTFRSYILF